MQTTSAYFSVTDLVKETLLLSFLYSSGVEGILEMSSSISSRFYILLYFSYNTYFIMEIIMPLELLQEGRP